MLRFAFAVFMAAQVAEETAVVTMTAATTFLQVHAALPRLDIDVISLLGNHGDGAGGAEDANPTVWGQVVLGAHFALSLTHRERGEV